jgi:outer membrane protein
MKYKMFLLWLTQGLVFTVALKAHPQDSLLLEQVIDKVLQKNPLIEQSLHKIDAANAQIGLSKSINYPFASADISYDRIGPVIQFHIPDAGTFALFPADNYDAHIAAQYTIYDFGKSRTETELAKNGFVREQQNTQALRNRLAYQTVNLFYAILYLQQDIQVLDKEIAALQNHLDVAQKRANTGSATEFDVLTTRVRVSNAQSQKVDAENILQKQWLLLRSLLADSTGEINIKGDFGAEFAELSDRPALLAQALSERQEMKLAENNIRQSAIAVQLASMNNNAQLKINGMLGVKNGYIPDLNEPRFNWLAGIGLHIPLFDGYATHFKEQQARANLAAAESYSNEIRRQVSTEVNQAVEDVLAQKRKLAAADLQLQQANEAVSLANRQYQAGVVTNLELLDAHTAQAQSRLQKSKVLYNLVLSEYKLEQVLGKKNW